MASNSWIIDTIADFIHSPIWRAPINIFIEGHCAAFDYDDDNDDDDRDDGENNATPHQISSSLEEQLSIFKQYQRLVDELINGLGNDLSLNKEELRSACDLPKSNDESAIINEQFEQLYAARNFELFQEMMRRKNLILQLQALVSLQLQWGIIKHGDVGNDVVLGLLLQATSTATRRDSVDSTARSIEEPIGEEEKQDKSDRQPEIQHSSANKSDDDDDVVAVAPEPPKKVLQRKLNRTEPVKPPKEEYHLPDLRHRGGAKPDTDWHRNLQQSIKNEDVGSRDGSTSSTSTPQTINSLSEEVLREKLRELSVHTESSNNNEDSEAIESRKKFLQRQRELIINKQRVENAQVIEQAARNARPQSAALAARKAVTTATFKADDKQKEEQSRSAEISKEELARRRALADKLKQQVIEKR